MGGYGLYVWGSYGVTFVLLGGEVLMLLKRKRDLARRPDLVVFHAPADLLYVRGVGAAMVEAMKPPLLFPPATTQSDVSPATTQPATSQSVTNRSATTTAL